MALMQNMKVINYLYILSRKIGCLMNMHNMPTYTYKSPPSRYMLASFPFKLNKLSLFRFTSFWSTEIRGMFLQDPIITLDNFVTCK